MKYQICTTNALTKWLKTDLPRLPTLLGKQVGVNSITSTNEQMCWQLHIIENSYGSWHKTIIATEANSRFTLFIPVDLLLSTDELTQRLQMEWQWVLAETLRVEQIMPCSDIALLLSELNEIAFTIHWVKNTDRSVNGHVSDAGLWVSQTLADRRQAALSPMLALELAVYLNTQPKRVNKSKNRFTPVDRLLMYCQQVIIKSIATGVKEDKLQEPGFDNSNVVQIKNFRH
jgi:hypothetical protein